jgi:hypothetical protein
VGLLLWEFWGVPQGGRNGSQRLKTPEMCADILDRLSQGDTIEDVCQTTDDVGNLLFPASRNVRRWMMQDADFASEVSRARAVGFDAMAERMRQTARGHGDSTGDVNRDKLIIETDRHLLGIWDARKFGPRQIIQGDSDAPPVIFNLILNTPKADG